MILLMKRLGEKTFEIVTLINSSLIARLCT
jgi:hypothetical protein